MMQSYLIAKNTQGKDIVLLSNMANRHGLITGATGTGKTVTLQKMAECFSQSGVPVFMADVKGDLSGIGIPGQLSPKLEHRLQTIGVNNWQPVNNPVEFWDLYKEKGHPVRATIADLGPILLARLLNLNETQTGVLQLTFRVGADQKMPLIDLKDIRAMIQYVGQHAKQFTTQYGNISSASIGAIMRNLLVFEEQDIGYFFGEPMLDIADLMRTTSSGQGIINILAAEKLYLSPRLYSTFLLWLLNTLFQKLPEVGDLNKPKLVFFFDEAHLLFNDIPSALLEKIEQVVRLIRSKGVGVYFITQNPADIPESVLSQLGNRVQHALRAFTPKDKKAVKIAAQTMPTNPVLNTEEMITQLGVGEALISFLDNKGRPSMVQQTSVIAPGSKMGIMSDEQRQNLIKASLLYSRYNHELDRQSAYEQLQEQTASQQDKKAENDDQGIAGILKKAIFGSTKNKKGGIIDQTTRQITRKMANQITTRIAKTILGILFGKKRK